MLLWWKYAAAAIKSAITCSAIRSKFPQRLHWILTWSWLTFQPFASVSAFYQNVNKLRRETHCCSETSRNNLCCILINNTLTVGLSVAVLYLFEDDVVHDDHGRQVGVGAPHYRQLGGLRTLLHQRAGRVLRVCGVHGAHVFGARVCRPQARASYNY